MTKFISIISCKGGVGKSTLTWLLWQRLQAKGFRCVCVDTDYQGNLSYTINPRYKDEWSTNIADLLSGTAKVDDVLQQVTELGYVIPSGKSMAVLDTKLASEQGVELRLKGALNPLRSIKFDFCLIDCPPNISKVTTLASLVAADECIIPAQADGYSIEAVKDIGDAIKTVRKIRNPSLKIAGIVLCRYNARLALSKEIFRLFERLASQYDTKVFKSYIRESVAIREAEINSKLLSSKYRVCADVDQLIEELLGG